MLNPNKYVRKRYIELLANVGVPVYDMQVPKDINPVPSKRILLSSQTKRPDSSTKCGHTWETTILLDIIVEFDNGYMDRAQVDDIEQLVSDAIDTWTFSGQDITIPPFIVNDTRQEDSHDMSMDTDTKSIGRSLVRYLHRINSIES